MGRKIIYHFGKGKAEMPKGGALVFGTKAAGLCEMASLGLPVPTGFVISEPSEVTREQLATALKKLGPVLPLAVRASFNGTVLGAMETILNVGVAESNAASYCTFLQSYAVNVLGLQHSDFEDMNENSISACKAVIAAKSHSPLPHDVVDLLQGIVEAAARREPDARLIIHGMVPGVGPSTITTTRDLATGAYFKHSAEMQAALSKVERHFKAVQEVTLATAGEKFWMLQTRPVKPSAKIELKLLVDMVNEGLLTREEAILKVDPLMLDQFLHPTLDPNQPIEIFVTGLAASPGAVSGQVVFDAAEAQKLRGRNTPCILVRIETSPEDIQGMHAADGVITARGGLLSHAAVIARGMGKPCVVGASGLRVDYAQASMQALGVVVKKGDMITLDGASGRILKGSLATVKPVLSGDFATILEWADQIRRMRVRANAETPHDARAARYFGAEGIGLCRTEHMFFSANRITPMRKMILAETAEARRAALDEILPMQRQDFIELFEIMAGLPVTIRLLDPPLHEFLPKSEHEIIELAREIALEPDYLRTRVSELQEFNPMLGHRGVRLAVSYPEIAEMQARAIFEATLFVARKYGKAPIPEIMIPLVVGRAEFDYVRARVVAVAENMQRETGFDLPYLVGTMIELPRAALRAGEIAESAEFFSFGTNDLTQTTLGISRDDSARFIGEYMAKGLLSSDPFISIDVDGVGELLKIAVARGRKSRPDLKLGICGEHAGDSASIAFCETINLDYVSCSPFRIAVARLAAAQATLRNH